jgi:sensor c-di-GMP phosphodiesterase-like protein
VKAAGEVRRWFNRYNLDLRVVAEGVETLEQAFMLKNLGCDKIQGYFLCKSVAAEDMPVVIEEAQQNLSEQIENLSSIPLISP